MVLQAMSSGLPEVCINYLALGGIFLLGGALGYMICTRLNKDPRSDLGNNLIDNAMALRLIKNYQDKSESGDAVSGHLQLGVLMAYVNEMQTKCDAVGKPLSGLEYYFATYGPQDHTPNENQNTIVIYPTYENGGAHIPFDPDLNQNVAALYGQFNADLLANAALSGTTYSSSNVLNRTHMSPPRQPATL